MLWFYPVYLTIPFLFLVYGTTSCSRIAQLSPRSTRIVVSNSIKLHKLHPITNNYNTRHHCIPYRASYKKTKGECRIRKLA
ncbi:hypothetical protein V1509DRAFT_627697 [Lipomyces kononenkoae]